MAGPVVPTRPAALPAAPFPPATQSRPAQPPSDRLRLARLLVLLELVVAAVATLESTAIMVAGVGTVGSALPTALVALGLAWQARRLGRGLATRGLRWLQRGFLAVALVDLGIRIWLVGTALPLVPTLVRVVLPLVVLRLVRLPGPGGSRRRRLHHRARAGQPC